MPQLSTPGAYIPPAAKAQGRLPTVRMHGVVDAAAPQTSWACTLAALVMALGSLCPASAEAQISVAIRFAPPPLLQYAQPQVPGEDYIWTPGYWAWSEPDAAYFWVPGTWVLAPHKGELWTPGYWAFEKVGYRWHGGYWGLRIGFYGGINYGHGYAGTGYLGGRWDHGAFRYNRAVSNVNPQVVHLTYNAPAKGSQPINSISFNGGRAGVVAHPSVRERQWQLKDHTGPAPEQQQHETAARGLPTQRATGPHQLPQVAATPKPSEFGGAAIEPARAPPAPRAGHRTAKPERTGPGPANERQHPGATPSAGDEPPHPGKSKLDKPIKQDR